MRLNLIILIILAVTSGFGQRVVQQRLAGTIDTYLTNQSEKGFSGSVVVAQNGKLVFSKPYKVNGQARFWIASNSKSFVAAGILKLQERGKLSVKDPITKVLSDVPADKRDITIHHLLSHTSGLPHRYAADGITDRQKAVNAILALPLSGKPGERFRYSNDGYTLLATIVETVSGRPFEDYLRISILRPAGLTQTGFWGYENGAVIAPPLAKPSDTPGVFVGGKSIPNWGYRGASGMFSTAEDVNRWIEALRKEKVLSDPSVAGLWGRQAMMQPAEGDEQSFYGYGWSSRYKAGKREYVRHTGYEDWLGHSSSMTLFENGDAIVVLSNAGRNGTSAWATFIEREIRKMMGH